ncbi:MAG: exosortase/archaeosortase family protein [Kiritimatiellaeota bacterium]|nr:exosortase/archaeosortase family protein [Kiritimatiellota bacterium]
MKKKRKREGAEAASNALFVVVRWSLLAVLAVAGWCHYRGVFAWAVARFIDPLEDTVFAWTPLVSFFAIYQSRRNFRPAAGMPSWRGFGWVVLFLAMAWVGANGGHERIRQLSLIGLTWAVPYAYWGEGVGRLMLFPAWLFLFTVPIGVYLDVFMLQLRTFSAAAAAGIFNSLSVEGLVRSGTDLLLRASDTPFTLTVAPPCSGARITLSLVAFSTTFAHFFQKDRLQRWALIACSVPIGITCNILRIVSVMIVARFCGRQFAMGYFHDYSGAMLFLPSILVIVALARFFSRRGAWAWTERLFPERQPAQGAPAGTASLNHAFLIVGLTAALAVFTFALLR